jgi:hypothetical protein
MHEIYNFVSVFILLYISTIFWWCKNISLHHHILDVVVQVLHLQHPVYATVFCASEELAFSLVAEILFTGIILVAS